MGSGGGQSIVTIIIYLAIIAVMLAGMWKVFEKAGKPGWAAIVPIYNYIVLLEIIGKPIWWIVIILLCAPVGLFLVAMELAKCFGKSSGWGIGLLFFLAPVGYAMLGFGPDQYTKPSGS